jgi:hypothetical protein
MKLTSTTDISSSNNESYFMIFGERVYFFHESLDMFMIKALSAITESLTREFEEETHKINKKEERRKKNHRFAVAKEGIYCKSFLLIVS